MKGSKVQTRCRCGCGEVHQMWLENAAARDRRSCSLRYLTRHLCANAAQKIEACYILRYNTFVQMLLKVVEFLSRRLAQTLGPTVAEMELNYDTPSQ
jgi:hypothetical protein